ncbi:MAG TPA: glycosyltransferase family 2 protein [Bryobacteraceae bacterium]|nr:glycosyltransferase family 2 protein [Bryobacteraceae bacterium]
MVREPGPSEVHPAVTVVVPTLQAGEPLTACLDSLDKQTFRDFEVIVVDNSGRRAVQARDQIRVISNDRNVGYGAAFNQAFHESRAPFLAVLNDDATVDPKWLEALLTSVEARPDVGMCASQVRLADDGSLDSAGMLICRDGSSKQRGHLEPPESYARRQEVLLPPGSAAFYRREMLDEIGLFDESFFLYCEDTDLGLRARWAAWECLYVPDAVVEHRYSHSAGQASAMKAYYVERNRLFLIVKNFPMAELMLVPFYAIARYFWHFVFALRGRGKAAEFQQAGNNVARLPLYVLRAHLALLARLPALWMQRRKMKRRFTTKQFRLLIRRFSISPRQVAAL